jgi:hypothetical protein
MTPIKPLAGRLDLALFRQTTIVHTTLGREAGQAEVSSSPITVPRRYCVQNGQFGPPKAVGWAQKAAARAAHANERRWDEGSEKDSALTGSPCDTNDASLRRDRSETDE